jgi:hypothetical protein
MMIRRPKRSIRASVMLNAAAWTGVAVAITATTPAT